MATFPTSIVSISDPTSGNSLNSPPHATQHATINDEVVALETKVGINNSADTNSIDYKLSHLSSISFATSGPQPSFTTSSTTLVDVTGATVTINPTKTVTVHVVITGFWWSNTQGETINFALLIDGVIVQQISIREPGADGSNYEFPLVLSGQASVSSGARIIKLQMDTTHGGTKTGSVSQANINIIYG